MVWFSEGVEYDIENPMKNYAMAIRDEMRAAIAAATRAGVSFYGVDPRGVGAGLDEAIDLGSLDQDFQAESGMSAVMNDTRRAQDFLRTMSSETGGFAVVNQNDLNGGIRQDHPGKQQLLPARVLPDERQAGRQVPQGHCACETPRPSGEVPRGVYRAEGEAGGT